MIDLNFQRTTTLTLTCSIAAAVLIGAVFAARWHQRSRKKSVPKKWKRVGELSEIFLYPLKSGKGIKLDKAICTDMGVRTTADHPFKIRDRIFMVFNEGSGTMRSARQHPHMLLIKLTYADGIHVTFEAPNMPALRLNLPEIQAASDKTRCTLWFKETVEAFDCGDEAAEWMSTYLMKKKSGARLGYHLADVLERRDFSKPPQIAFKEFYEHLEAYDSGAFADLVSYLLVTEESVKEIHNRVASTVPNLSTVQFRPNLVVRGCEAYDEDNWDWIRIGDNVLLRNIKPCTRCILTTIDPETGVFNKEKEPLKTLKTYRQVFGPNRKMEEDAPVLGRYIAIRQEGLVHVGDPVYVNV